MSHVLCIRFSMELLLKSKLLPPPTQLTLSSHNPSSCYPQRTISIVRGFLAESVLLVSANLWFRISDQMSCLPRRLEELRCPVHLFAFSPSFGFLRVLPSW
ncbi:hypothetical protein QCA50_013125 [Cerrena zonata]|uniref:Uncharacterized protein n=1 Tax=Cerrena zonata TaxID=2478898 RepID=A0AAW0FXB8_9APHY